MATSYPGAIPPEHAVYGLKAYLLIGDSGVKYPITSVSLEYSVNQIPMASVMVPDGIAVLREVGEGDASYYHSLNQKIKAQIVIDGKGKPHPNGVSNNFTPTNGLMSSFVLFDGYILASHRQYSTIGISFTLTLVSWLNDLDVSTLALGNFSKSAPQSWFSEIPNPQAINIPVPDTTPIWVKKGSSSSYLTTADITENDWWADVIKPALLYKAQQPLSNFIITNAGAQNSNQDMLAALERIESKGMKLNANAKIGLNDAGSESGKHINEIYSTLRSTLMDAAGGSSAFEKISSLSGNFYFALFPQIGINKAIIKPYNPLAKLAKQLSSKEFDLGYSTPSPLVIPSGVLLYGASPQGGGTGAANIIGTKKIEDSFIGQYPDKINPNELTSGPILVVPSPAWMHSVNNAITYPFDAAQGGLQLTIKSDTSSPTGSNTPAASTAKPIRAFNNAFAKSIYFNSIFSSKTQEIICGFRTDLNVGDCISLIFNDKASGEEVYKRGMINSVIYVLFSGESSRVNTIYKLKHVFDDFEIKYFNKNTSFELTDLVNPNSDIKHPMFDG